MLAARRLSLSGKTSRLYQCVREARQQDRAATSGCDRGGAELQAHWYGACIYLYIGIVGMLSESHGNSGVVRPVMSECSVEMVVSGQVLSFIAEIFQSNSQLAWIWDDVVILMEAKRFPSCVSLL